MAAYDRRTRHAADRWSQLLPEIPRQDAARLVEQASAAAEERWRSWCAGETEAAENADEPEDAPQARASTRPGAGLVPEVGSEDPEHPAAPQRPGAPRLQQQLTSLADACVASGLARRAQGSGDWERQLLLTELTSTGLNHEWLWRIDPNKGAALSPDDFVAALRLRLGAGGPSESVPCACCNNALLGPSGSHALLCAQGHSIRGHNAVRDVLYKVSASIAPTTELEPTGLIPTRPLLRPADLLSGVSGFSGRLAALDVGICSPAAVGAGDNCVESMRLRKQARMQPFADVLGHQGIEYKPITFSCYGRPHEDAKSLMRSLGRQLARRSGTEAHIEERRLAARINIEIWRRAAKMLRQCLPYSAEEEAEANHPPLSPPLLLRVGPPGSVEPPGYV